MTIRWCAYCQNFLGEIPPFSNFDTTHGICAKCAKKGISLTPDELQRARHFAEIQKALHIAGTQGAASAEAVKIIDSAAQAGMRAIDVLMGVVTPALRQIGMEWERGEISVSEEHRFTAFCERVFELVRSRVPSVTPITEGLDFLVVTAPGNYHTLGVRVFALWLESNGFRTKAIHPGIPASEIAAVVLEFRPRFLGISIAVADQIPAVEEMVGNLPRIDPLPEIILGGRAVQDGLVRPIPGVRILTDPFELLALPR